MVQRPERETDLFHLGLNVYLVSPKLSWLKHGYKFTLAYIYGFGVNTTPAFVVGICEVSTLRPLNNCGIRS